MIDQTIHRVRLTLRSPSVTAKGLAMAAGLHRNTLLGVERDDWNPSADTLRKLEPHLIDDAEAARLGLVAACSRCDRRADDPTVRACTDTSCPFAQPKGAAEQREAA